MSWKRVKMSSFQIEAIVFFVVFVFCFLGLTRSQETLSNGTVFVVMSQPNNYYDVISQKLKTSLISQMTRMNLHHKVLIAPDDFSYVDGYWSIFPLMERLIRLKDFTWVFFLEWNTAFNLQNLMNILDIHLQQKNYFIGNALKDRLPTIIHHFDDPHTSPVYPHFSSGMAVTLPLLTKAFKKWKVIKELTFTIDAKYEFAKFLRENCNSVRLKHEPLLCGTKHDRKCATWIPSVFPACGMAVSKEKVFFAVKTCMKFHLNRVEVVKGTWAQDVSHIQFYSDMVEASIPTVVLDIENVPRGHCMKTLEILKHFIANALPSQKWLILVDDDTLLSVPRLLRLLSCFDDSKHVALGERYGYGIGHDGGYDYITGGGGMGFTIPTVKQLIARCECPAIDSPDDMIIGLCLKRLGIPIIHMPYFHQARPEDYSEGYLESFTPVSFHKHWMVDPYKIYKKYLQSDDHYHDEL